jgi:hypothetical protein
MGKVRTIFKVLPLVLGISVCLGQADPADQQLSTAVGDRVDIRSQGAKPFQLEADFTAQVNVPQGGTSRGTGPLRSFGRKKLRWEITDR